MPRCRRRGRAGREADQRIEEQQTNKRSPHGTPQAARRRTGPNEIHALLQVHLAIWVADGDNGVLKVNQVLLLQPREFVQGAIRLKRIVEPNDDELCHPVLHRELQ